MAGWAADPSGKYRARWFDGYHWTTTVLTDTNEIRIDTAETVAPQPVKKPNRDGLIITLIALATIGVLAWLSAHPGATTGPSSSSSSCKNVTYRAFNGSGTASMTMSMDGGTVQRDLSMPGSVSAGCLTPGSFLYISAQDSDGGGSISCSIEVDGVVAVRQSSTGKFSIATCTGHL